VAGSKYERPIQDTLRKVYYDSAEAKIHQLKIKAALREIGRLRATGDGYVSIVSTLFARKITKLRRNLKRPERTAAPESTVNKADGIIP
jgi:hypothetical protein